METQRKSDSPLESRCTEKHTKDELVHTKDELNHHLCTELMYLYNAILLLYLVKNLKLKFELIEHAHGTDNNSHKYCVTSLDASTITGNTSLPTPLSQPKLKLAFTGCCGVFNL